MHAILAEAPPIPSDIGGKYVAAAYIVLFLLVLIYVAIMATRLSRIERELGELLEIVPAPQPAAAPVVVVHDLDLDAPAASTTEASTPR